MIEQITYTFVWLDIAAVSKVSLKFFVCPGVCENILDQNFFFGNLGQSPKNIQNYMIAQGGYPVEASLLYFIIYYYLLKCTCKSIIDTKLE